MATADFELTSYPINPAAAVADMPRAREFYEGTLGLTAEDQPGGAVSYPCGRGTRLLLYPSTETAGTSQATLAGFEVPDVEAAVSALAARGVTFERYDRPGLQTDDRGIMDVGSFKSAWFRDPDGNTFAVVGA